MVIKNSMSALLKDALGDVRSFVNNDVQDLILIGNFKMQLLKVVKEEAIRVLQLIRKNVYLTKQVSKELLKIQFL